MAYHPSPQWKLFMETSGGKGAEEISYRDYLAVNTQALTYEMKALTSANLSVIA
jgi:hypothetical protein